MKGSLLLFNLKTNRLIFWVEWSLLGAIRTHCAYYFTYIPYNYQ